MGHSQQGYKSTRFSVYSLLVAIIQSGHIIGPLKVVSSIHLSFTHPFVHSSSFIHSFIHSFLHLIFSIDLLFHSCEFNYLNQFNQPSFYLFVHHFSFICFSPLIHCVHLIISLLVLTTAICVLINLHLTGGVAKCQPNVYLELEKLASEVIKTRNIIVSINAFR